VPIESETNVSIITPFLNGVPYHSRYSGYERLVYFLKPRPSIYHTLNFPRATWKVLRPLRLSRVLPKFYDCPMAEELALRAPSKILHHLYGEDTFLLSGPKPFRGGKKIVVTFHQPKSMLEKVMPFYWKKLVRTVDCIVALDLGQFDFLREEFGGQVVLVEHGVDTEYFSPVTKAKAVACLCLSVGDHLRDYPVLLEAMRLLSRKLPKLRMTVVSNSLAIVPLKNVTVVRNISDERLRDLYRSSHFLVLPVRQVTASNTLLEAMACGLPVITTRAFSFYTRDRGCLYYQPGNPEGLAESMQKLASSQASCIKLGVEARNRALELSWTRIAKRIMKVYDGIA
jgi:glycosyltransferase involved in cell wall biosynthesis